MVDFLKPGVRPDPVSETGPRIPRKLWQTTRDRHAVKPLLQKCVDQLKDTNPGWDHRLFDDETQWEFLRQIGSERLLQAYRRINPAYGAARADFFRYVVTYMHGGAYLDLKSGTTRPLDDILRPDDRFIISQWDKGPGGAFPEMGHNPGMKDVPGGEYEQWFIIAEPGHPYLRAVIERMLDGFEHYRATRHGHGGHAIFNLCGPNHYTRAIRSVQQDGLHRRISAWRDGVRYTMLDDLVAHQDANHYGFVQRRFLTSEGLSARDLPGYWLAELIQWPVSRLRTLNHKRLYRRWTRAGRFTIPESARKTDPSD